MASGCNPTKDLCLAISNVPDITSGQLDEWIRDKNLTREMMATGLGITPRALYRSLKLELNDGVLSIPRQTTIILYLMDLVLACQKFNHIMKTQLDAISSKYASLVAELESDMDSGVDSDAGSSVGPDVESTVSTPDEVIPRGALLDDYDEVYTVGGGFSIDDSICAGASTRVDKIYDTVLSGSVDDSVAFEGDAVRPDDGGCVETV